MIVMRRDANDARFWPDPRMVLSPRYVVMREAAEPPHCTLEEDAVMWGFWLILIFAFLFLATVPGYPYSRRWGYYPAGGALAGVFLILILIWLGYVVFAWPWADAVYR